MLSIINKFCTKELDEFSAATLFNGIPSLDLQKIVAVFMGAMFADEIEDFPLSSERVRAAFLESTNFINLSKEVKTICPLFFSFEKSIQLRMDKGNFANSMEKMAMQLFLKYGMNEGKAQKLPERAPNAKEFSHISEKMKEIYGFDKNDIDGLSFFVSQVCDFFDSEQVKSGEKLGIKREKFDISLTKVLYLFSDKKGNGKSTFARALSSVLNGEIELTGDAESSLAQELQFSTHLVPQVIFKNCVVLDESFPKSTKKVYNSFKSAITSEKININPKFETEYSVSSRRNYIITSNYDTDEFVQDKKDRRLIRMEFKLREPKEDMSQDEIFEMMQAFVRFCPKMGKTEVSKNYKKIKQSKGCEARDVDSVIEYILFNMNCDYFRDAITQIDLSFAIFNTKTPAPTFKHLTKSVKDLLFKDCKYSGSGISRKKLMLKIEMIKIAMKNKVELEDDYSFEYLLKSCPKIREQIDLMIYPFLSKFTKDEYEDEDEDEDKDKDKDKIRIININECPF